MQGKTVSIVESNLTKVIEDLGFELYDVEFAKKQNGMNLTIFISCQGRPINISDCELVHRTIDPILDELDPTNGESYYLNVSSVGLDRPLKIDKDFRRCLNTEIYIKQYTAVNSNKEMTGQLIDFDEKTITLNVNEKEIKIDRQNIAVCKPNIKI